MAKRQYRVKVKKGVLRYSATLQVKTWFFWLFVEGYKIKIGQEHILTKTVEDWCEIFDIKKDSVIVKL